ncbi:hypothetical protein [Bosea sp. (in: a-proteobacteria)]|uniref:hypothetical protein n=1 Tax=Bosea sp. (in: a-proteobacteria) TaxID=1871050 RepID=UPI00263238BD|nr:hypothetical protein [Bosea sp. (in: a-proteobacteria)]MCO5091721.1 hypothetical protein [Bosea sp. (in: a-proteobacteria)]
MDLLPLDADAGRQMESRPARGMADAGFFAGGNGRGDREGERGDKRGNTCGKPDAHHVPTSGIVGRARPGCAGWPSCVAGVASPPP